MAHSIITCVLTGGVPTLRSTLDGCDLEVLAGPDTIATMSAPIAAHLPAESATPLSAPVFRVQSLSVSAGKRSVLRAVNLEIQARQVFGIIGPSGAGKSTLLRCLNRMIDLTPNLQVEGDVQFHSQSIRAAGTDVDALRARIGMLFQQPVVFPKSIYENVIFGVRHLGQVKKADWPDTAERALREAALWNEVKDRRHEPAMRLSVGQQQRLCLARALAVNPDVILMDEPTSALDPKSTESIEELIPQLKSRRTVVLVTHNLAQARRVTDWVTCLGMRDGAGEALESAGCNQIFSQPQCREVAEYLGRKSRE
jgi:phosphate transport system ATP-binding protein